MHNLLFHYILVLGSLGVHSVKTAVQHFATWQWDTVFLAQGRIWQHLCKMVLYIYCDPEY